VAGNTIDLDKYLTADRLGCEISRFYMSWDVARQNKKRDWEEVRKYVYATDTTTTTNSKLPWKNKTTLPKLCQIRDNLLANYEAALFPRRKWLYWLANDKSSNTKAKKRALENYANSIITYPEFKREIKKCLLDYIDYGNCFATYDWIDQRQELDDKTKVGYVGPMIRRISPLDIVFNPTADNIIKSPKIVRSLTSLGEVKEILERETQDENREHYEALFNYLREIRQGATQWTSGTETISKDAFYQVDGFTNFSYYLQSGTVEILTFYGDIYDSENDVFYKNYIITVVDRHKVLMKKPNPGYFGYAPLAHVGWRVRQDNPWAMGPLDNLVGLQYRLDHIENLKSDVFDLITFPPLKVKGYIDDFTWAPMEKIHIGDSGDVEMVAPPFQVLQANIEITAIEQRMEEMAGAPKEAMGIRTPGEKTAYEVQRLENAAARLFQAKSMQFEEQFIEPLINFCIELGRRNMTSAQISVFDDEFNFTTFQSITPDDIKANGRIVPIAARNFAEKANLVQNLTGFYGSAVGADPAIKAHFSSVKLAQLFEDILDLTDYEVVTPYIRLTEEKQAKSIQQTNNEQNAMEAGTPSGLSQDDYDADLGAGGQQGMPEDNSAPAA